MRGYPAAQMDADGRDFFEGVGFTAAGILYPDSGHACAASGGQAHIGCRADQRLFQLTHVPANITPNRREIQNGITDDLSWAVISNVAASVGRVKFDVHLPQQMR